MAEFIDIQFAQMLSGRLDNFKIKNTLKTYLQGVRLAELVAENQ